MITEEAHKIIKDYGTYLDAEIQKWAVSELNSADPRFVFKREKICDVVVLQKKKFYILHILDSEGVPVNKFEYKGIEVAKSIMSKEVKEWIDRAGSIMTNQKSQIEDLKAQVNELKAYKKWAEHRILRSDQEENNS